MPKITKQTIDALVPNGADRFIWDEGDGALKGFGVRMSPAGVGSFLVQYRTAGGRRGQTRRLTIGRVGVLTPDQARTIARETLVAVAKGADPSEQRREARDGLTVGELCDWYLTEAGAGRLLGRRGKPIKASTLAMDKSRIDCHVKPLIGARLVTWLTLERVAKLQADIAEGKTAKARPARGRTGRTRGGRGAAGRTVGMLEAIIEHGRRSKGLKENPARGVRRYADNKVERYLTFTALGAFGKAMREAKTDGASRTGLAAIRALLLTGCRKAEILTLPRAWFDPAAQCIRFDDTKTGAQIRPLGAAAVEHLAERLADQAADGFMFPADKGDGHFVNLRPLLDQLCARAGLAPGLTPHMLRHTFGSIAAALGYTELVIKGLLGHAGRGATQIYTHVPDAALLSAADRVAARIAAALDGGAEIIPLRVTA
jgi:integrase